MSDLSMIDERGWALLDAYLAGACSPEDAAFMRRWTEATPEAAAAARELRTMTVHPEVDTVPFDTEQLFQRISAELPDSASASVAIPATASASLPIPRSTGTMPAGMTTTPYGIFLPKSLPAPRPAERSRTVVWGALCAVLGLAFGLFGHRVAAPWLTGPTQHEYSTTRGQQINLTLEDGTEVWLAPDTRLRYTEGERNAPRTVVLDGEAVFTVQHADRSPFVVRSNGVDLRVLGTTFGVRSYPNDGEVRVAIHDGKVAVNDRVLTAGDVAWASGSSSEVTVQHHQPVSTLTGWRSGQLIFIDARLDDVVASLSRWYDLEFVLAAPRLAERHVSATFDAKHLTTEDLNFLSTSLGVRYSRTGRTITLSPQTP